MAVINTNVKALFTQNALKVSGREQSVAMQQLSTGKRINSARDDAAGLAISKQMTQQIRSMNMAIRNAGDAVSLIQTAEGATGAITDMLQRMRELAVQAINDTNSGDQRGYLDLEFQQLKQQIVSISQHTEWNGFPLLNGTVGEPVGERPVYRVASQPMYYVDPAEALAGIEAGDIIINDVTIRSALPLDGAIGDDEPMPTTSSQGSAIAIAKAINEVTELTGVAAVVNPNSLSGTAMSGESKSGYFVINGFRTGDITTTLNNSRVSREDIVKEINVISEKTGVVAIDTGNDKLGIRLEAKDGRNIAVEHVPSGGTTDDDFSAATGVRQGLQVGTYSLETKVEGQLNITSSGDWMRAGIRPATKDDAFNYNQNISIAQTNTREEAIQEADIRILQRGDLVINGIEIRGALAEDDDSSYGDTVSSSGLGSAKAMASAINAHSDETGVRAIANPLTISGAGLVDLGSMSSGSYSFFVNGAEVTAEFEEDYGPDDWLLKLADAVNAQLAYLQISATAGQNGLNITAEDGRNLSVWFDSDDFDASFLGLEDLAGSPVAGVTGSSGAGPTFDEAATVYGSISLVSEKSFEITPGFNAYGTNSHFLDLGFKEGVFGGEVDQATSKMTPPNVGRLSFHVGASATQTIHIDFADYGAGGPITGDITGDVALSETAARVNRIDSGEAARSVLAKLDVALDKVNGNRAVMGAVMNRLDYIMDNLANVSMNTEASRSQIEDADYAKASTQMARTQIMQQAATAVLAQANMDQQTVLKLLQ
jgi:flagellin